jgi:hypothetical protein
MADAAKRPKEIILTSPKGVAKWAKLNKPDTKFKADGEYSITLLLDPEDAATIEFVDSLKKANEDGFGAAKKADPKKKFTKEAIKVKPEVRKIKDDKGEVVGEEETGKLAVSFTCKAAGVRKDGTKWAFRPAVLDAKGKPVPADVLIYGGSVVKVAYSIRHTPMPTGLFYTTFNLKAVQVIVLKSQSDRDAAYYGFQEEEGYGSEAVAEGESYSAEAGSDAAPTSGKDF